MSILLEYPSRRIRTLRAFASLLTPNFSLFLVALLLTPYAALVYALDVPPLTGRIVDQAHLLPPDVTASLTEELAEHERKTGNQVAVLTVPSLEGDSLEEFSHRVASTWQLGRKGTDNGVLIVVVPNDRRVRIEVGYGLEGTLTDAVSSRIIRHEIVPRFRRADYSGGLVAGVRAVLGTIEGTYRAPAESQPAGERIPSLAIAILVGAFAGAVFGTAVRVLGAIVGGGLSFMLALAAGLGLALVAGVLGMLGALVLAALFQAGGRGGRLGGWHGPSIGSGGWPGGGWSSTDSWGGGGGGFGGGGASGRW